MRTTTDIGRLNGVARLGIILTIAFLAHPGGASLPQTSDPASKDRPKPAATDPLKGPAVAPEATRRSIVERDFYGAVRRPEGAPEEEAFRLLKFGSDEEGNEIRAQVDSILIARMQLLDTFVGENLDLIVKIGNAAGTGNQADMVGLIFEAMNKLRPLHRRGTLENEISGVLPGAHRAEFKRLLTEYRDAIVAERRAELERNGEPKKDRFGILSEEHLKTLGREIERSVQRQLRSGDFVYRYLTRGLDLTPEQHASIRDKCRAYSERVGEEEIKSEQVKLFFAISAELTPAQRIQFARLVNGTPAPPEKPRTPTKK